MAIVTALNRYPYNWRMIKIIVLQMVVICIFVFIFQVIGFNNGMRTAIPRSNNVNHISTVGLWPFKDSFDREVENIPFIKVSLHMSDFFYN